MKLLKLMSVLMLALFVGCTGSSDNQQNQETGETEMNAQNEEQNTQAGARTIDIIGVNSMKFAVTEESEGLSTGDDVQQEEGLVVLDEITASPGETITIRLTTRSDMPPTAMSHNWVLLGMDVDDEAFATASAQARDNDYIASDLENQVIAATDMAGGGETVEVTFTVPEETGEYPFVCTFPGHYLGGMEGTLVVEE